MITDGTSAQRQYEVGGSCHGRQFNLQFLVREMEVSCLSYKATVLHLDRILNIITEHPAYSLHYGCICLSHENSGDHLVLVAYSTACSTKPIFAAPRL